VGLCNQSAATIDSVQQADFKSFYETYYRPDNAVIIMVGDSDVKTMKRLITDKFGDWSADGEPPVKFEANPVPIKGKEAVYYHDPEISTGISLNVMSEPIIREDNAENRKLAFEQELRRAIKFGFSQAELDEQLANSRKSAEVAVQTSPTRRTPSLASGLINGFYNETVVTSPETTFERFVGFVDDITLEDAQAAFEKIWSNYETPQIYMSSPLVIEDAESVILKAYDAAAAVTIEPLAVQEKQAFAYTDFGPAGKIVSRSQNDKIGFETVTFENNVVLHFKKTDFRKDVISIRARIDGTSLTFPQDLLGLAGFASTALNAGGLGAHSNDELQTILAGKAIGASLGVGQGSFTISGATVPEDLPDQLNLMVARMTDPGYREEALTRYVKSIENVFNTLETTPRSTAGRYLSQILRDGNPRYRSPEKDEYLTANLSEVKDWITPYLKSGAIEIGVVGDFDPEQLVEQPYNSFKDWPRSVRLSLINSMLRLRLIEVLREDEGATYSPGLTGFASELYPDYAYSGVTIEVSPDDIDGLYDVIDDVTGEMHNGDFDADLLDRARKPVLERFENSLETNGYWMGVIARAKSEPWNLERHLIRQEQYSSVTIDELKAHAGTIYDPQDAVRIKIIHGDTAKNKAYTR